MPRPGGRGGPAGERGQLRVRGRASWPATHPRRRTRAGPPRRQHVRPGPRRELAARGRGVRRREVRSAIAATAGTARPPASRPAARAAPAGARMSRQAVTAPAPTRAAASGWVTPRMNRSWVASTSAIRRASRSPERNGGQPGQRQPGEAPVDRDPRVGQDAEGRVVGGEPLGVAEDAAADAERPHRHDGAGDGQDARVLRRPGEQETGDGQQRHGAAGGQRRPPPPRRAAGRAADPRQPQQPQQGAARAILATHPSPARGRPPRREPARRADWRAVVGRGPSRAGRHPG